MSIRRTLLSGLLAGRRRGLPRDVLSAPEFQRRLKKERLRADRARSSFALLAMRPPDDEEPASAMAVLARRVVQRVRFSDDVGLLGDGRLGVFLPDTPAAGAWQVAEDVLDTYAHHAARPQCEVYVYPFGPLWDDDLPEEADRQGREVEEPVLSGASLHGSSLEGAIVTGEPALNGSPLATGRRHAPARASALNVVESKSATSVLPAERLLVARLPWWKRATDVLGAASACVVLSPLFILAALAIKLTSRGPVFFAQDRDGLGGRPFRMVKFRTMRVGADAHKHALRRHSEQDGPAFKMRNDPRLTWVGRLLRATSIDELPQLWNVLRGEMSLVGPRPLPCDESAACQRWQRRRLEVTPGLTCIWQVSGRNLVAFDEWMRMDLRYVDGRSLWLDFKLLLRTLPAVLSRKGAM
jgi:lipopolysaccharide/colanic/teichoic acid biosynthesis glycosyltransferase